MMLELKVVQLEQIQPFVKQFRLLDLDGNARLGRDDLEGSKDKSIAELQMAANARMQFARRMTVGERMGVSVYSTSDADGSAPRGAGGGTSCSTTSSSTSTTWAQPRSSS